MIHNYPISINLKYSDKRKRSYFRAYTTNLHEISGELKNKLSNS